MIGLSASTAARKNCFTAASLYFCCVSTATSTSAAWRIALARCQFTVASESTSGASKQQQPRRHRLAHAPEQPILGRVAQRIVGRMPGVQIERLEQPRQQGRIGQLGRHEAHRMFRAGGQRAGRAGHFAGQMVEDRRLADVRAADDRHDQQRRQIELRPAACSAADRTIPGRPARRTPAAAACGSKRPDRPIEPSHLGGEGLVVGGHSAIQPSVVDFQC